MSERINEIATQAENYAHEQNDKFGLSYKREYDKKFAELIIREGADVLAAEVNRLDGLGRVLAAQAMDTAQVLIKKHFELNDV